MHLARVALDAAGAEPRRRSPGALPLPCGRALRRLLRGGTREGVRASGGDRLHVWHGGRRAAARGRGGARGARAPDRAERRPPTGAARSGRRADDRPARHLRRLREVVLRGGHARGDARAHALDALAGVSCGLDSAGGQAGRGAPQLPAARAAGVRRASGAARGRTAGRRAFRPPPAAHLRRDRCGARASRAVGAARRGVLVAGRHERDTPLGAAAAAFCAAAGWPLLADPMSGARRGDTAIAHYDALLRDAGVRARAHARCRREGRRSAGVKVVARLACDARWDTPGRARPGGCVAGPCERRLRLARARARRGARGARGARAAARGADPTGSRLAQRGRARRGGDPGRAFDERPQRARDRRRARRAAAGGGDAVRGVLDAGARRRDLLASPRRPAARAVQPRGERDRRDGVERVRGGRGPPYGGRAKGGARWCC